MEARTVTIRERETPEIDANTDLITRIYTARHGEGPVKVDYAMTNLEHYNTLSNIDTAVRLIVNAIQQDEKILIIGDFDVDGATSCALGVRTLKSFGVKHVDYLVPNRFEFGYGLTPELVQVACENKPDLIITVDNGIANHAGVEYAREQGK